MCVLQNMTAVLERRFEGVVTAVNRVPKEDLQMANHLCGHQAVFLQLKFRSVQHLMDVRRDLLPIVERNTKRLATAAAYGGGAGAAAAGAAAGAGASGGAADADAIPSDYMDTILDLREYDVPYYVRVSIDCDVRVGSWYRVKPTPDNVALTRLPDMVEKAEPRVLAFDIETTKAPLKFPDVTLDRIYMISYMLDNQGYLIINREIVSEDVDDFEYTPKPAYKGPFKVWNEANEEACIARFFQHIKEVKPQIFVTYNGDYFDWPFVEKRAATYGMDMEKEIGVAENNGEYRGRTAVHMDAFYWVKRDSYLPQVRRGRAAWRGVMVVLCFWSPAVTTCTRRVLRVPMV